MLIRLQSPTPSMMAEAFRLAAQYGYAIDITKDFGAITTHEPKASRPVKADKPRIETKVATKAKPSVKPSKAVKQAPKPVKTESAKPETAESIAFTELRKKGSALRELAESGAFRLTPKVYGDLRSKDISKLEAAVRIADGVAQAAPEAKPAKAKKAPRKLHPSRRIPLSERVKLTESTPSPEEMEMSAEHIEAELHKALLADLPLLEEEMDEDEESDEVEELEFSHE